jgi:LPXTG-motif cell wall-anchored protein
MKKTISLALPALLTLGLAALPGTAMAAGSYSQVGTATITPQESGSFDITWYDPGTNSIFLADRTNKAVDMIDGSTGQLTKQVGAGTFVGVQKSFDYSGPDGVLVIGGQVWAGDGDSTVKVIDIASNKLVASISTGGKARADELAYDPQDHLVLIANDADTPPFLSLISTATDKVVGKIPFPDATDGLEQPVYDPATGMFYQSVPQTKTNPGGEIAVIDPTSASVKTTYQLTDCAPAGLALGPDQHLVVGCSSDGIAAGFKASTQIVDATTGKTIASVPVGGSDEVWYNAPTNEYFAAADAMTSTGMKGGTPTPVLAIINAATNKLEQTIPTAKSAHSVAVDSQNDHVFVAIPGKGVAIYAPAAAAAASSSPASASGPAAKAAPQAPAAGAPAKLPKTGAPASYSWIGLCLVALGGGLLAFRRRDRRA